MCRARLGEVDDGAGVTEDHSRQRIQQRQRLSAPAWARQQVGANAVLAIGSLIFIDTHPKYCTVLYCVSCLLDAFDGMAARALNQSTQFGAVLDMVTDWRTMS